jgi:hypothetical protein
VNRGLPFAEESLRGFPGNANLSIGGVREVTNANREIGVPRAQEMKERFLGERRIRMTKKGDIFRNLFSLCGVVLHGEKHTG